jgi:type IV secretory pathway VirB4 component
MQPNQQSAQPGSGGSRPAYGGEDYTPGSVNTPGRSDAAGASKAPANPNSTQNALLISEVRDGIVIMNDGTFRAVVMCKSINFDLMSPQEREAVEFSYQGFLNSLYFPVQIFVRSQKVDLRPYLERMDKIRTEQENMLLGLLMEDYIAFLADISQQTNIMDKRFYVAIKYPDTDQDVRKAIKQSTSFFTGMGELLRPSKPAKVTINEATLETAKTELRNRVQAVMQGLAQAGVQSLPLDTEELIELYYDVYNPDTATRQQIKNFNDLTAPIITKGDAGLQPDTAGGTV